MEKLHHKGVVFFIFYFTHLLICIKLSKAMFPDAAVTRDVILKKIENFNKNGTDIEIVIADYYTQKGGLKLEVRYGSQINEISGITTKIPINNE